MREFDMLKDTSHYQKTYLIPTNLQHRVCMCETPGAPMFANRRPGPYLNCCSTCRKPYRWYVRVCTVCNKKFIKDWRAKTTDCVKHTKCWDCAVNTPLCPCEKESAPSRADFGPLGLNPREFTEAEMDAVFDMGSPFD